MTSHTTDPFKLLKARAHQVRAAAWERAAAQLDAGPHFARVEAECGKPVTALRRAAAQAEAVFRQRRDYARALEDELAGAEDEPAADRAAERLMLASCRMAEAEVQLVLGREAVARAERLLGDLEAEVQRLQHQLCAGHPVCQAYEQGRQTRRAAQQQAAGRQLGRLACRPVGGRTPVREAAALGPYARTVWAAADLHRSWHRRANAQARRLAAEMNRFQGPYVGEAPTSAERFEAFGNLILAFSPAGKVVARWAAAADGAAYPLTTRREHRKTGGRHGVRQHRAG